MFAPVTDSETVAERPNEGRKRTPLSIPGISVHRPITIADDRT